VTSDATVDVTADLTLEELCAFVAGDGVWTTPGCERLGLGKLVMTDGPNGARGSRWTGLRSTCFPSGSALGATWDTGLIEEVGGALGREARHKGAHLLLAPTVNLHRHPLGGRHFECMSEDPILTGRIAVAYVRGVQSEGVACTIKHFVANDSEFERMSISSDVDERTLRELYLVPFEMAVTDAGVWAVMSAYNRVNGTFCASHRWLLTDVLRDEWGFDGIVVSDWFGTYATDTPVAAGLDIEMPGPPIHRGHRLLEAIEAGTVAEADVRAAAARIERTMARLGVSLDRAEERSDEIAGHSDIARRAASSAIVLVRNDGTLPLDSTSLSSLAVLGPNAQVAQIQGGGSAGVTPHRAITPLDGLRAALGDAVAITVERGCVTHRTTPPIRASLTCTYRALDSSEPLLTETYERGHFLWIGPGAPQVPLAFAATITGTLTPAETGDWTLSLIAAGRARLFLDDELVVDSWEPTAKGDAFFGQGFAEVIGSVPLEAGRDYAVRVEFANDNRPGFGGLTIGCLAPVPADLMDGAVAAAAGCDAAVVVVGTNDDWETEGHDRSTIDLPGRQVELIRAVCAVNPRTVVVVNSGGPVDVSWLDEPAAVLIGWFSGQEWGAALADVLLGVADPGGRMPTSWPRSITDAPAAQDMPRSYPGTDGHVSYSEGLLMGYRWYDAKGIEPAIPFGHGLSYTTFDIGAPQVSVQHHTATLTSTVTNTGSRPGSQVVQCYVDGQLRAFDKVHLAPGASRDVVLELGERAFAHWDESTRNWSVAQRDYEVRVGASSRDERAHRTTIRLSDA
jgi:beta-glucosidase